MAKALGDFVGDISNVQIRENQNIRITLDWRKGRFLLRDIWYHCRVELQRTVTDYIRSASLDDLCRPRDFVD